MIFMREIVFLFIPMLSFASNAAVAFSIPEGVSPDDLTNSTCLLYDKEKFTTCYELLPLNADKFSDEDMVSIRALTNCCYPYHIVFFFILTIG